MSDKSLEMEKTIVQSEFGFRSRDRGTEKSFKPAAIAGRSFLRGISDTDMASSLKNKLRKPNRLNVTDQIGASELKSIKERKRAPKAAKPGSKGTSSEVPSSSDPSSLDPSSLPTTSNPSSSVPTSLSSSQPSSLPATTLGPTSKTSSKSKGTSDEH